MSRRSALTLIAAGVVAVCAGCSHNSDHADASDVTTTSEGTNASFGAVIDAGAVDSLLPANQSPSWVYVAAARTYLVRYPMEKVAAAKAVYPDALHAGLDAGLLALYQRCTHLGCRVPRCESSGMFECPCHGGMFSAYGEWRAGPPPRGMDNFAIEVRDGHVFIDTTSVVNGLPKSVDVTDSKAIGPHCVA